MLVSCFQKIQQQESAKFLELPRSFTLLMAPLRECVGRQGQAYGITFLLLPCHVSKNSFYLEELSVIDPSILGRSIFHL
jgi:hypothetical protein